MRSLKIIIFGFLMLVMGLAQKSDGEAATPENLAAGLKGMRVVRTTAYTYSRHALAKDAKDHRLKTGPEHNAAADWSRLPLGTKFKIAGSNETYVINDYGSALVGTATVDLYMPTHHEMSRWGVRHVPIEIIEPGSYKESLELLKSRTHVPYVRKMVHSLEQKL
jgi:3D (Asp-Asp-Asp) domain-containing protein